MHTQSTLLSCSQSFIYPLNPFFSIACEQLLLSHEINLFCVWLEIKGCYFLHLDKGFWNFLTQFSGPEILYVGILFFDFFWFFWFLRVKWNLLKRSLGCLDLFRTSCFSSKYIRCLCINLTNLLQPCLQIKQPEIASWPHGSELWCKHLKLCCSCATNWNKLDQRVLVATLMSSSSSADLFFASGRPHSRARHF